MSEERVRRISELSAEDIDRAIRFVDQRVHAVESRVEAKRRSMDDIYALMESSEVRAILKPFLDSASDVGSFDVLEIQVSIAGAFHVGFLYGPNVHKPGEA